MQEVFLSDNAGHRVAPYGAVDPKFGTGQTLTNGSADTNTTATVVAGARYAITVLAQSATAAQGGFLFGLATTATAANICWVCPVNETIIIQIPVGYTTLHYQTDLNNGLAYLRELSDD